MGTKDIVTYYQEQWDNTRTSNVTPKIAFHIETDELEDGEADVPSNFSRCVFFKLLEDKAEEIGIHRTHQNEESADFYECTCVDESLLEVKKLIKEIRRIALLNLTDDLYSYLDFEGAKFSGQKHRKQAIFEVLYIKSGIAF